MHFCDLLWEEDSVNNRNEGFIDRRAFLKAISAAGGAVGLSGVPGVMSLAQAAEAPTAAAIIHGKSAKMIVHNGKLGVMETRSEEHTSELQSLMRISYAVFCLKKKTQKKYKTNNN